MKLQLKRSNVIESGAAKLPTSAQLEYGELAINYNQEDPAIFLKDSNNNVIRISGIGNIADDGQVELPASTTPPANPLSGNLWFNSDDGRLYIYYTDADSSQWVDASPDSWDPSSYPDLTDPTEQPNTLDDRYVSKVATTSQDMAGDLTFGTDKITLDATGGSATFADRVDARGGFTVDGGTSLSSGIYYRNDAGDKGLRLYSGGTTDAEKTVEILTSGAASFAGGASVAGGSEIRVGGGSAAFAVQDNSGTGIYAGSAINLRNTSNDITVDIKSTDGSASFASEVVAGVRDVNGVLMTSAGTTQGVSGGVSRYALSGADGSANFTGYVQSEVGTFYRSGSCGIAFSGNTIVPVNASGSAVAAAADIGNFNFGFNNATFTGTVTANGTVLTRASGDLDVGDRLEKADAALQTLKTAAAAASDFAALKSAIATALANI